MSIRLEIELDRDGRADPGVDHIRLLEDLDKEIADFVKNGGGEVRRQVRDAPPGSQGEAEVVLWLIDLLQSKEAMVAGLRVLLFALNEILNSVRGRAPQQPLAVRLTVLGRDVTLPLAVGALKSFLDDVGAD